ncbi:type II toxin-antitoxin system RelE/ParE family toxin [Lacinutrix salivirga]
MNYNYKLTNEADNDLNDIFYYTEKEFSYNQAVIYLTDLETVILKITKNPKIRKKRKDLKRGLFSIPEQSHIIFYFIEKEVIIITRILHTSKDLKNYL